jgi:hypothetical protein
MAGTLRRSDYEMVRHNEDEAEIIHATPVDQFVKPAGRGTFNQKLIIANVSDGYFDEIVQTTI